MTTRFFCYENKMADKLIFVYNNKIIYQAGAVWQFDINESDSIIRALFDKINKNNTKNHNLIIMGLFMKQPNNGLYWTTSISNVDFYDDFEKEIKNKIKISTIE